MLHSVYVSSDAFLDRSWEKQRCNIPRGKQSHGVLYQLPPPGFPCCAPVLAQVEVPPSTKLLLPFSCVYVKSCVCLSLGKPRLICLLAGQVLLMTHLGLCARQGARAAARCEQSGLE